MLGSDDKLLVNLLQLEVFLEPGLRRGLPHLEIEDRRLVDAPAQWAHEREHAAPDKPSLHHGDNDLVDLFPEPVLKRGRLAHQIVRHTIPPMCFVRVRLMSPSDCR